MFDFKKPLDELVDLLEQERDAILDADFARLERIFAAKQRKFATLPKIPDGKKLTKVKSLAADNQRLLEAAAKGVRAAMDCLQKIQEPAKDFNTYDQFGKKAAYQEPSENAPKRA